MSQLPSLLCRMDEVFRGIGIGKDTLRMWEHSYGFAQPQFNNQIVGCSLVDIGNFTLRIVVLAYT